MRKSQKPKSWIFSFLCVSILAVAVAQATSAQEVGDMYKKCKYWALSGYPSKLEFKKSNLAAFQCNELFQAYRMSGKAHCQLTTKGLAGFVPPFEGYAFDAPSNSALVDVFISYAESNPRDWDKNVYSVIWKFPMPFGCR